MRRFCHATVALDLASLSSNRVQAETLLIDEGFGTLDPDTLDTAIAALDACTTDCPHLPRPV